MFKFIKSVIDEMKLVTWPTFKDAKRDFNMVIQYTLVFTICLKIFDWLVNNGITQLVKLLVPLLK